MKKIRRYLLSLCSIFVLCLMFVENVSAGSLDFSKDVPTAQGYANIGYGTKTYRGDVSYVYQTRCDPSGGVTYYPYQVSVGILSGAGKTTKSLKKDILVPYGNSYPIGVGVETDFRNTNWSLNSNKVAGTYKW